MYEFGDTILDLTAVIAIQWAKGTSSIVVATGVCSIYLTPEYKDTDEQNTEYAKICELRHKEIVAAWKEAKSL